jgi:hypothetical protein
VSNLVVFQVSETLKDHESKIDHSLLRSSRLEYFVIVFEAICATEQMDILLQKVILIFLRTAEDVVVSRNENGQSAFDFTKNFPLVF